MAKKPTERSAPPSSGDNNKFDIDHSTLRGIIDDLSKRKLEVGEATGKLRSDIKTIIDEYSMNKKALAVIREFAAMSPTARADCLRSFDVMYNRMYEKEWGQELQDMIDSIEAQSDD